MPKPTHIATKADFALVEVEDVYLVPEGVDPLATFEALMATGLDHIEALRELARIHRGLAQCAYFQWSAKECPPGTGAIQHWIDDEIRDALGPLIHRIITR
jgi:hypothetical protein